MIAPKALRDSQEAVLRLLRELGEMSDDLLVERYQAVAEEGNVSRQSPSGIRSRRSELVELGLVRDSGRKVILEPSGRRAIVWELTAAGASGWRPSRVAGSIESSFLDGPGTSVRTEAEYDPEPDL